MTELIKPTRAKVGYIETRRLNKGGKVVKARDHVLTSQGMHSAKEMEKEMIKIAKDVGASEDQIRIETFKNGEAPIESNPRHRGLTQKMEFRGERRQFWGGFNPKTDS